MNKSQYEILIDNALTELKKGEKEKAGEFFKKAMDFAPNNWKTWGQLSADFSRLDMSKEMKECLNKSIQCVKEKPITEPEDYDGWYFLGQYYLNLNQKKQAYESFRTAQKIAIKFDLSEKRKIVSKMMTQINLSEIRK